MCNMKKRAHIQNYIAMFSSQVFQEGQMHFQFITHWTREHAELEDFQPHRRIFGVNIKKRGQYIKL